MDEFLLRLNNPHWYGEWERPDVVERPFMRKLLEEMERRHVLLYGPRQVGKTTAIRYAISQLLEKVKPEHILYFSFDNAPYDPVEVVKAWWHLFSLSSRQKLYIFFDEIQKVEGWGEKVKVLMDNTQATVVLSGSASSLLKKGRESLAGRVKEMEVEPLSLLEYCSFTKSVCSEESFWKYLHRQMPLLALGKAEPREYMEGLVKKAIGEDAVHLFHVKHPEELEMVLRMLVRQPGQEVKVVSLAKEIGMSRNTLSHYLRILEDLLLIRKLYNWGGGVRKSEVKGKRFYPYFPNLFSAYLPFLPPKGLVLESYVAWRLKAEYFYRHRSKEVDFIVCQPPVAVEVKGSGVVEERDVKTLLELNMEKLLIVLPSTKVRVDVPVMDVIELEKRQGVCGSHV